MIGPIGVDHADLRDRRIAPLFPEIGLAERDIVLVHSQPVGTDKALQPVRIQLQKAAEGIHSGGKRIRERERFGEFHRGNPALHRVDDVFFDLLQFPFAEASGKHVYARRADDGAVALRDDLNALRGGIRALIELPGEILHRERGFPFFQRKRPERIVQLRLREHRFHGRRKERLGDILRIVPVQQTDALERLDAQEISQLRGERAGLVVEALFFLNVNSIYHFRSSPSRVFRYPCAGRRFQNARRPRRNMPSLSHPAAFLRSP